MGYGLGAFLLASGLILALAVQDRVGGVDLSAAGYILALVGVVTLVLTAVTANRARGIRTTESTTDSAGRHVLTDRRTEV
jgi:hypothetical protein